jgi:hypothetical protein
MKLPFDWMIDGVLVGVFLLIGLYYVLPITRRRRDRLVFYTCLWYYFYLLVLIIALLALVIWEAVNHD